MENRTDLPETSVLSQDREDTSDGPVAQMLLPETEKGIEVNFHSGISNIIIQLLQKPTNPQRSEIERKFEDFNC